MADIEKVIIPALLIPLLLIISVSVYMSTTDSTSFAFEVAKTLEDTGEDAAGESTDATTLYACKKDSVTAVTNTTNALAASTGYNVTYVPLGQCTITVSANVPSGSILATYTSYSGDGYDAFDKLNDNSYSGFQLASLLPYVVVAMAILALIVASLAFK